MSHHYTSHGLLLDSELALPQLHQRGASASDSADAIAIRFGDVVAPQEVTRRMGNWTVADGSVHLTVADTARYQIRADSITIDAAPGASASELGLFLLGTCLGALLYMRGDVPLHASTVEVTNGCVCIIGRSGSGKSTTAAALTATGRSLLSDDVTAITPSTTSTVWAAAGYGSVKLREDAIEMLGLRHRRSARVGPNREKFRVEVPFCAEPRKVRGIIALDNNGDGVGVQAQRLGSIAAVRHIMSQMYRPLLGLALQSGDHMFQVAASLERSVGVLRVQRPAGSMSYESVTKVVEQECARLDAVDSHE